MTAAQVIREFLLIFFNLLWPILLIFSVLIIIKVIYQYKKFGSVIFNLKSKETKFTDMFLFIIDKFEGYRKVFKSDKFYADFIIVDKTGLYLIKLIKYDGIIYGKRNEKTLKNKIKLDEVIIDNPFYLLDKEKKILNYDIKTILVTSNIVSANIDGVTKKEFVNYKNLYFVMKDYFSDKEIYDKKEIDKIYKEIS